MEFIEDSLVIGQEWKGDQRVVLFVIMKSGFNLDSKKVEQIKSDIRSSCSHRHVPEKVIETEGIPYTINGIKVEIAVKNIIQGKDVNNQAALINPDVLEYYSNIPEILT